MPLETLLRERQKFRNYLVGKLKFAVDGIQNECRLARRNTAFYYGVSYWLLGRIGHPTCYPVE
jgi:hypothetical protein